jgi:AraC family transcriptional regulator of adaptative response/methylated-DNA-[protein]-cysteine methyltransferase
MSSVATPRAADMERAFYSQDASFDGLFVTGVRTTGIFCRPSCSARKPLRQNLEFFGSVKDALFAGYRPCLRCRPLEASGKPPAWVAELLAAVGAEPERRLRARELRARGVSPERARRYFQRTYGMSFDAYCRAQRLGRGLKRLREGEDLAAAALDAGYESESGFREAFGKHFGRTPGAARDAEVATAAWLRTPLGPMIAAATSRGLCLLEFTDRRMLEAQLETLGRRLKLALVPGENETLERARAELAEYFDGRRRSFELPLHVSGSPFQERVWHALLQIPYGETRSYQQIAERVGSHDAVRAVGTANGMNRIAIVIPCHRVVNKGGKLGGYGGGLWRKQRLLGLEQGQRIDGLLSESA